VREDLPEIPKRKRESCRLTRIEIFANEGLPDCMASDGAVSRRLFHPDSLPETGVGFAGRMARGAGLAGGGGPRVPRCVVWRTALRPGSRNARLSPGRRGQSPHPRAVKIPSMRRALTGMGQEACGVQAVRLGQLVWGRMPPFAQAHARRSEAAACAAKLTLPAAGGRKSNQMVRGHCRSLAFFEIRRQELEPLHEQATGGRIGQAGYHIDVPRVVGGSLGQCLPDLASPPIGKR
jgi:hypothetical protein